MTQYKLSQRDTTHGPDGEHHLIRGQHASMRLWHREEPQGDKPDTRAEYETLGYVISGRAELTVDGETVTLEPGDSYYVPMNAPHHYRILETLTAVEVNTPPTGK
ncbi:cupin domain-containing protein [Deinococcus multiflagellatus]|uniref:Cupin domain-containing protein n=1 Tax=Deinococcus multiflagellatus TaxID=1656887 RepID=A0ABW1ZLY1_9DEIO|nr:cupin domain-containing protein [Deinococcus multiflagellatus]MBZ9715212.1 cupin domain-containing protein [Deinococcus multiflagellatus]